MAFSLSLNLQSNFLASYSGHTRLTPWSCEFTLVDFETRDYYKMEITKHDPENSCSDNFHPHWTEGETRPEKDWNSKVLKLFKLCYF